MKNFKKESLGLNLKEKLFNFIYWIHFIFFILINFNIKNQECYIVFILLMYILALIMNLNYKKCNKKVLYIFFLIIIIFLKQVFYEGKLYNFPIYTFLLMDYFLSQKNVIKEKKFIKILNTSFIFYLLMIFIRDYFNLVEVRNIVNRFPFASMRFIGIGGSPAGPDLFFFNVFIINLYRSGNKIFSIFGLFFFLLTGSLSPIVAFILAKILIHLKKIEISIIFLGNFIVAILFQTFKESQKWFNKFSTYRVEIWSKMIYNKIHENLFSIILGSNIEYNIFISNGRNFTNPHNYYINLFLKGGMFLIILYYFIIKNKYIKLKEKNIKTIIILQLIYMMTNWYILGITANPVNIYILYYYLFVKIGEEKNEKDFIY